MTQEKGPMLMGLNPQQEGDLLGKQLEIFVPAGQPDWAAIPFEVCCPRCGYNLRMLPQPRCPECGLEFDWATVVAAAAFTVSRYRLAYQWMTQAFRALRPVRSWRQLPLHEPFRIGPLVLLIALSLGFFTAFMSLTVWERFWYYHGTQRHASLYGILCLLGRDAPLSICCGFVMAVAILATLALLCGLRQTLGRCRVSTRQILRLIAFASVPVSIYSAFIYRLFFSTSSRGDVQFAIMVLGAPPALLACSLVAGLRDYLRMPQAYALGIVAAGVGFLFSYTMILVITVLNG